MAVRRMAAASLIGLVVGVGIGVGLDRWIIRRNTGPVTTAGVFEDVLSAIRKSFVDSLSDAELYARAAKGVVSTLGDPYSSFLAPGEYRQYSDLLEGRGHALGFTVADAPTGVWVDEVYDDSPADRAGVTPGLRLVEVSGRSTDGVPAARVETWLRGDSAPVSVRLARPDDSVLVDLTLDRGPVKMPAVVSPVRLTDRVGYVAVRVVSAHAARQLQSALERLDADELDGLVLDLRGNPGGRLDEALAMADLFLDPGQPIGSVAKRMEFPAHYAARQRQPYPGLALAILVDRKTASSAEIVAAALRDNGRAVLLGERTLGKGLVQTTIRLGDSVGVRLSTGRWQTPSGQTIEQGLTPDSIAAADPDVARIARMLADHWPVVTAAVLQQARELAPDAPDSTRFDPAALSRLEARLRKEGARVPPGFLAPMSAMLGREARRLAAVLHGDETRIIRLGLLTDPVVAAGLQALDPTSGQPVDRAAAGRP